MTIAAYQTLYESSVAFGMRKSLMSEQGKTDMEQTISSLNDQERDMEKQVHRMVVGNDSSDTVCSPGDGAEEQV